MTPAVADERELGPLEWLLWLLRINAVLAARITGPLETAAVRDALDRLQRRHPLLRSRIESRAPGQVLFSPCDRPLVLREEAIAREGWVEACEAELATPHPAEGPLFRCTILRHGPGEATLLIVFHHSIGDGRAGTHLFRELLAMAGGQAPEREPLPLRPALESEIFARVPAWERWWRFASYTARQHGQWLRSGKPFGIVRPEDAGPAQAARLAARPVDSGLIEALSERAAGERASVHAALCAAQFLALAARSDRARVPQVVITPASPGKHFDLGVGEDFLLHVYMIDLFHEVERGGGLWPLARAVREQLIAKAANPALLVANLMTAVPLHRMRRAIATDGPRYERWVERMRRSIPPSTLVSSVTLGDVPQDYGHLHFAWWAGFSANDFTGFTTVLTRIGRSAHWSVTHSGAIARETMRGVMDDMQALLEEAAR